MTFFTKANQNTLEIVSSDIISEFLPQNRKVESAVCSVRSGRFTINTLSETASRPVAVPFFKQKYFQIFVVWKERNNISFSLSFIYL